MTLKQDMQQFMPASGEQACVSIPQLFAFPGTILTEQCNVAH